MTWVRIDDHFDEHPKMQRVGPLGWGVWLAGLAYSNRNLTDGFIPWNKARLLCSFEIVEDDGCVWDLARSSGMSGEDVTADWIIGLLVDAGLWSQVDNGRGRIDGYLIHDFEDYQPSREQVVKEREKNAERQRRSRAAREMSHDDSRRDNENVTDMSRRESQPRHKPPVPVPVVNEVKGKSTDSSSRSGIVSDADAPTRKPARTYPTGSEEYGLAVELADRIRCNNPKAKPITEERLQHWANDVRLMVEQDARSIGDIRAVIDWSQRDEFWMGNILSMGKLREQFDRLWVKKQANGRASPNRRGGARNGELNGNDWIRQIAPEGQDESTGCGETRGSDRRHIPELSAG